MPVPQPGYVLIIHPDLGPDQVSEVPESSLPQWHRSGWRRLAEGDLPPARPQPEPAPMTRAEAARTAAKAVKTEEK